MLVPPFSCSCNPDLGRQLLVEVRVKRIWADGLIGEGMMGLYWMGEWEADRVNQ